MNDFDTKEQQFLRELRKVCGRPMLPVTKILEWAAMPLEEGEEGKIYFLPEAKVYVKVED